MQNIKPETDFAGGAEEHSKYRKITYSNFHCNPKSGYCLKWVTDVNIDWLKSLFLNKRIAL
jgi:hypothetical protein